MFSTSCHYALQAMIFIALRSVDSKNVDLSTIAEELDIPKHFLSKILQILVKHKLLDSMKGPTGGFRLKKAPQDINLMQIVGVIDGLEVFSRCGIGFKECDDKNPCPIHFEFGQVREQVRDLFETKTLEQLTKDIESGNSLVSLGLPMKLKP